jgi:hypothetical protein
MDTDTTHHRCIELYVRKGKGLLAHECYLQGLRPGDNEPNPHSEDARSPPPEKEPEEQKSQV